MTEKPTYIPHETAQAVAEQSRDFATAQLAFEQALRTFISDNDAASGKRNDLRDYVTALAAGESPTAPDYLNGLDITNLTSLARTAKAEADQLSTSIQQQNIVDAAGATTVTEQIADRVSGNPNRDDINDYLDIRGAGDYNRAIEYGNNPDTYPRKASQYFIEEAYQYQRESTRYGNEFTRFVESNNLTEAQGRELDAYLGQLREGAALPEMSPLIARLADEHESKFRSLSERARDLNGAREEFAEAIDLLSKADGFAHFAGKETELFHTIDRLTREYDHETRERILDTVIDRVTGRSGEARRVRETGWPDGTDSSYELGRTLLNIPQSAGDWFTNLFEGFGGEGEGNGLPWQGLLGGLLGGAGGFFAGRMFGGGIIGTIASAALGIMGAYMGFGFANRHFGNGNENEGAGAASRGNSGGGVGGVPNQRVWVANGRGSGEIYQTDENGRLDIEAIVSGRQLANVGVQHDPDAVYRSSTVVGGASPALAVVAP